MRGHDAILQARMRGSAPAQVVFRFVGECPPVGLSFGEVEIDPRDTLRHADLRFVVGLPVFVWGDRADAVKAWGDACLKAGARSLVQLASQIGGDSLVRVTDCDGNTTGGDL